MSDKIKLVLRAPVASLSGYGSHARDIAYSFIKSDKFDVFIEPIGWGSLPLTALDEDNERNNRIKECIHKTPFDTIDVFITVSVPNEYERRSARLNCGITAGVEVDRVAIEWLQKANQMDLNIVPSKHSKLIFEKTSYTMYSDPQKQNVVGQEVLRRPIEIVFEGVDTEIYNDNPYEKLYNQETNEELKFETDFNFLFVGHWLNGGMNEDRKNVAKLIRMFNKTFLYNKKVGLIIKTAIGSNSIFDKYSIERRIEEIRRNEDIKEENSPPIYLIHGDLSDKEMSNLYKHPQIKGFITLTHGEGYGRPIAEASACNLPIIATGWSGQLDFLDVRYSYLLKHSIHNIPKSVVWNGVIPEGSNWAEPDEDDIQKALNFIYNNYDTAIEDAKKQGQFIRSQFSLQRMEEQIVNVVEDYYNRIPTQHNIILPKLKKIALPDLKMPKLENNKNDTSNVQ